MRLSTVEEKGGSGRGSGVGPDSKLYRRFQGHVSLQLRDSSLLLGLLSLNDDARKRRALRRSVKDGDVNGETLIASPLLPLVGLRGALGHPPLPLAEADLLKFIAFGKEILH